MFIVGLPRSRTAWLSVFMSQSSTYFYHEAINGCYSMDEYDKKVNGCGDSTTGFLPLIDRLNGKKTVVIRKNEDELLKCIEWCDKTYKFDSKEVVLGLNRQLNAIDGLVINQSEIGQNLKNIWSHLVDDEWNDRYLNLTNMSIQVKSTDIDTEAAKALHASIQ